MTEDGGMSSTLPLEEYYFATATLAQIYAAESDKF